MTRLAPRTSDKPFRDFTASPSWLKGEDEARSQHFFPHADKLEQERTIFVRDLIRDAWREHRLLIIGGSLCGLAFVTFLLWGWPR